MVLSTSAQTGTSSLHFCEYSSGKLAAVLTEWGWGWGLVQNSKVYTFADVFDVRLLSSTIDKLSGEHFSRKD